LRRFARLIAGGFGAGCVPLSPGTAGSALALLAAPRLMRLGPLALPIAALGASLAGLWSIRAAHVEDDPGWVVIDEIAGQLITLIGLARPTPFGLAASLTLFRVLDISKLGPVGWADRQAGAVGVMADDLIAGGISAIALRALRARWPHPFE
jgi:phosphatidylglycerophosphatase A